MAQYYCGVRDNDIATCRQLMQKERQNHKACSVIALLPNITGTHPDRELTRLRDKLEVDQVSVTYEWPYRPDEQVLVFCCVDSIWIVCCCCRSCYCCCFVSLMLTGIRREAVHGEVP